MTADARASAMESSPKPCVDARFRRKTRKTNTPGRTPRTPPPAASAPRAIDGVLISREDAAELVKLLDVVQRDGSKRGASLSARHAALRRQLAEITSCVESRKVAAVLKGAHDEHGLVDTAKAAQLLEVSESNVRDLCKRKSLPAMQVGGRWWISRDALAERLKRREDS